MAVNEITWFLELLCDFYCKTQNCYDSPSIDKEQLITIISSRSAEVVNNCLMVTDIVHRDVITVCCTFTESLICHTTIITTQ